MIRNLKLTSRHSKKNWLAGMEQNRSIAESLSEIARMLSDLHANDYRIQAYRNASRTLRDFDEPIVDAYQRGGMEGLIEIPTIGAGIAKLIVQNLKRGRMELRQQLEGWEAAEDVFAPIPGVGQEIAHRIFDHLAITTLPELRAAAKDGRLKRVTGIGEKRLRQIHEYLDSLSDN